MHHFLDHPCSPLSHSCPILQKKSFRTGPKLIRHQHTELPHAHAHVPDSMSRIVFLSADRQCCSSEPFPSPQQLFVPLVRNINPQATGLNFTCHLIILIRIYMELLVKPEMLTSYIYMDLRLATLKQSLSICCTMFQH